MFLVGFTIVEKLCVLCWVVKFVFDIFMCVWVFFGCDLGLFGWGNLLLWYWYWFCIVFVSFCVGMGVVENEVCM